MPEQILYRGHPSTLQQNAVHGLVARDQLPLQRALQGHDVGVGRACQQAEIREWEVKWEVKWEVNHKTQTREWEVPDIKDDSGR